MNQDIFKIFLTNAAYNIKKDLGNHLKKVPTDWELLATSNEQNNTSAHNYRSAAFINKNSNEVIIATAGTDFLSHHDLWDDALVLYKKVPYKINSLKNFTSLILDKIKENNINPDDITFNSAGHSLGAVVSDLTIAELMSRGLKVKESVTFDSPGSKAIVDRAIENKLFTGEINKKDLNKIDFKVYNASPNLINTTNPHIGKVQMILPVSEEQEISSEENLTHINSKNSYFSYLYNNVGTALNKAASWLGFNKTNSILEDSKDHLVTPFDINKIQTEETKNDLKNDLNHTKKTNPVQNALKMIGLDEHLLRNFEENLIDKKGNVVDILAGYGKNEVLIGNVNSEIIERIKKANIVNSDLHQPSSPIIIKETVKVNDLEMSFLNVTELTPKDIISNKKHNLIKPGKTIDLLSSEEINDFEMSFLNVDYVDNVRIDELNAYFLPLTGEVY